MERDATKGRERGESKNEKEEGVEWKEEEVCKKKKKKGARGKKKQSFI